MLLENIAENFVAPFQDNHSQAKSVFQLGH
jgi:hypothetical protein